MPQPTAERRGYANCDTPKTVMTRSGTVTVAVPQVRDSSCCPQALEHGLRSARALTLALTAMSVQGGSTPTVAAITEQVGGGELTSTQVRRAAARRDAVLAPWRIRPLPACRLLWLEARNAKGRIDGQGGAAAGLLAIGLHVKGNRVILDISVAVSEPDAHWRQFLPSRGQRGLSGVQLIVSEAPEDRGIGCLTTTSDASLQRRYARAL